MHAYSSPPEASLTLLARRRCFHGDTKLLSRVADPLLLGSGKLKKNPSMLKQGTWGHHEASLHAYFHPLGLGHPNSPLTLLVHPDNIHELLVELVACLLETVALGMNSPRPSLLCEPGISWVLQPQDYLAIHSSPAQSEISSTDLKMLYLGIQMRSSLPRPSRTPLPTSSKNWKSGFPHLDNYMLLGASRSDINSKDLPKGHLTSPGGCLPCTIPLVITSVPYRCRHESSASLGNTQQTHRLQWVPVHSNKAPGCPAFSPFAIRGVLLMTGHPAQVACLHDFLSSNMSLS